MIPNNSGEDQAQADDSQNSGATPPAQAATTGAQPNAIRIQTVDTPDGGKAIGFDGLDDDEAPDAAKPKPEDANSDSGDEPKFNRIRLNTDDERAVAAYARAKNMSLVEASLALYGSQPTQSNPVNPPTEGDDDSVDFDSEIKGIDTQITTLRSQIKEATAEGDMERFYELNENLTDLKLSRQQIEFQAREAEEEYYREEEQERSQAVSISTNRATQAYPELTDEANPMRAAFDSRWSQMERAGDPILQSPQAPELVAAQVAAEMGMLPASHRQAAAPQNNNPFQNRNQPGQPVYGARPIAPTIPGNAHSIDTEQRLLQMANSGQLTNEQYDAILNASSLGRTPPPDDDGSGQGYSPQPGVSSNPMVRRM